MKLRPFHLAIPVKEIKETRRFYRDILNCKEGRSSEQWVDFNFYGHQLVIHISENMNTISNNSVDGHAVPIPHFGVILERKDWQELADRLKLNKVDFIIEPYIRFDGQPGEQATMFFLDPSGNALEFKSFENIDGLFQK